MLGVIAAILFSCSGTPGDADDVVERMINAYGGPEKVELMQSFVGKGFVKDPLGQAVIRYWPYDHFQRDTMLKTKVVLIEKGIPYNIRFVTFDGLNYRVADKNDDMNYNLPIEIVRIKSRFPFIFDWLRNSGLEGSLTDNGNESGICRIEYIGTYDVVEVGVDRKNWLLTYVEFEDRVDSMKVFRETYSDYWKVDGVPFPSRFTGILQGKDLYYEYYFVKIELGADLPDSVFTLTSDELDMIPDKGTKPAGY
jgi:hypothetical protein